jgi:hypothetical protein
VVVRALLRRCRRRAGSPAPPGRRHSLARPPVDLGENHRRLGRVVFRQVEAYDLAVGLQVHDAHERILDHAEILAPLLGLVDRDRDHQARDRRGHVGQADLERLVVALAGAGLVVARMFDRAAGRGQLVIEDEVVVAAHLAVVLDHEQTGVQVEVGAVRRSRGPAQPDQHFTQTRVHLGQAEISAFLQTDCHRY